MSEEPMNNSTFSRLFILMIITMSVLTIVIMMLASIAASDVNGRLDERSDVENSASIVERIAPVGQFSVDAADALPVVEAVVLTGAEAYTGCAACHAQGIAGAPAVGDTAAWSARIAQGMDALYDHAINGYQGATGIMPAKGGNNALADDSVKAAVEYMIEQSR